jgi:sulfofructose kinase
LSKESVLNQVKNIDAVGLGQCCLDYIGKIETFPAVDSKCETTDITIQGGGPVATALVALSRWKINCAFMGITGDDRFGDEIRASLETEGIDLNGLKTRRQSKSQAAFIVVEKGTGHRNIFWQRPTGPSLTPAEIDFDLVTHARVLHTDGLFSEAALAAAQAARKAAVPVVVDAGTLRPGLLELADKTDCFIASEAFSRALVGRDAPRQACRELSKMGPSLTCITLGARGYVALYDGCIIEKSAYPVAAVDTTGCGDIFHAGFIYGLLQGWTAAKCLDFAAWSAAMVSRAMGGRKGIPRAGAWPGR